MDLQGSIFTSEEESSLWSDLQTSVHSMLVFILPYAVSLYWYIFFILLILATVGRKLKMRNLYIMCLDRAFRIAAVKMEEEVNKQKIERRLSQMLDEEEEEDEEEDEKKGGMKTETIKEKQKNSIIDENKKKEDKNLTNMIEKNKENNNYKETTKDQKKNVKPNGNRTEYNKENNKEKKNVPKSLVEFCSSCEILNKNGICHTKPEKLHPVDHEKLQNVLCNGDDRDLNVNLALITTAKEFHLTELSDVEDVAVSNGPNDSENTNILNSSKSNNSNTLNDINNSNTGNDKITCNHTTPNNNSNDNDSNSQSDSQNTTDDVRKDEISTDHNKIFHLNGNASDSQNSTDSDSDSSNNCNSSDDKSSNNCKGNDTDSQDSTEGSEHSSEGSTDTVLFPLDAPMVFISAGLRALALGAVSDRFSPEQLHTWNLLSRTTQHAERVRNNRSLAVFYIVGAIFRYFFLMPMRVLVLVLSLSNLVVCTSLVGCLPNGEFKTMINSYVVCWGFDFVAGSLSVTARFHNPENRPTHGIAVANHTSPIDGMVLATDNCYDMVGQMTKGLLGVFMNALAKSSGHIWFERSNTRDRNTTRQLLSAHVQDTSLPPIIIYPEGVCVNNTAVLEFRKGAFEIDCDIFPIAMRFDPRYGDAFWSEGGFASYLFSMFTSWAIVCNVFYLPPMRRNPGEPATLFASRVRSAIAKKGGFVELGWSSAVKFTELDRWTQLKGERKKHEQKAFARSLSREELCLAYDNVGTI